MDADKISVQVPECPEASDSVETQIRQAVDELIRFVCGDSHALRLMDFERLLWARIAVLFRLCVALFLALRHERLDLSEYKDQGWRVKKRFATRTIKTMCGAVMTLDLRHAEERLWKVGRLFHKEGSSKLAEWVEPLNRLLLAGRAESLLERLQEILDSVPLRGPNTRHKRETLSKQIGYFARTCRDDALR